jgi:hypothetical protein
LDRALGKAPAHVDITALRHTEIVYRSAEEIRKALIEKGAPPVLLDLTVEEIDDDDEKEKVDETGWLSVYLVAMVRVLVGMMLQITPGHAEQILDRVEIEFDRRYAARGATPMCDRRPCRQVGCNRLRRRRGWLSQ